MRYDFGYQKVGSKDSIKGRKGGVSDDNTMISIIVPIYNVEKHVKQCINSLINQTYSNIEILLIDDGSTDRCGEICDSYTDSRITVFHTNNFGLSSARNLGIDNSHGDFLFFVDGDDWIDPDLLKMAIERIGEADILCFCDQEGIYSGIEALSAMINEKISMTVWDKFYRKKCFSQIRFPQGRIIEDVATTYKVLHSSKIVKCFNIDGYHHIYREDSISNTYNTKNLIDCWLSVRELYEYSVNLVDSATQRNLLKHCATAIARAWAWRNINDDFESPEWERMSVFAKTMIPKEIRSSFSIRLRGGLFLARFNTPLSFWIANKIHLLIRCFT